MRLARGTHKRTKLKVNLWSTASSCYHGNSASPTTATTAAEKRKPSRYSIYVNYTMRWKTIPIFIALPANTKCVCVCVCVRREYDKRQVPILRVRIRISAMAGLAGPARGAALCQSMQHYVVTIPENRIMHFCRWI